MRRFARLGCARPAPRRCQVSRGDSGCPGSLLRELYNLHSYPGACLIVGSTLYKRISSGSCAGGAASTQVMSHEPSTHPPPRAISSHCGQGSASLRWSHNNSQFPVPRVRPKVYSSPMTPRSASASSCEAALCSRVCPVCPFHLPEGAGGTLPESVAPGPQATHDAGMCSNLSALVATACRKRVHYYGCNPVMADRAPPALPTRRPRFEEESDECATVLHCGSLLSPFSSALVPLSVFGVFGTALRKGS